MSVAAKKAGQMPAQSHCLQVVSLLHLAGCVCAPIMVCLHCGPYEWKALYFIKFFERSPCFDTNWLSCGMLGTAEFKLMCQVGGSLVTK